MTGVLLERQRMEGNNFILFFCECDRKPLGVLGSRAAIYDLH